MVRVTVVKGDCVSRVSRVLVSAEVTEETSVVDEVTEEAFTMLW